MVIVCGVAVKFTFVKAENPLSARVPVDIEIRFGVPVVDE